MLWDGGLCYVKYRGGGETPGVFKGAKFTNERIARAAIERYLQRK